MPPTGLAILMGAGPAAGAGIARMLSHPSHGNLAVAILARRPEPLNELASTLRSQTGGTIEAFPTQPDPESLKQTFAAIKSHPSFANLKLALAIYSVKHSSKKPFLDETYDDFTSSLETYVGGAFSFAQESLRRFFADHGEAGLAETGGAKKGTLIFTGTLGALRCSAQFAAYGAGRAGVRQLAQTLAREYSEKGVHVVHTIANGGIVDAHDEDQKVGRKMSADAVGETYLWLHGQKPELWTHELDLRPACEKF